MPVNWNLNADLVTFDAREDVMADALLREFYDNNKAQLIDGIFSVSYEEIARLEDYDRTALELPDKYPYTLRIDAIGDLHEMDFRFTYSFCQHFHGEVLTCNRNGCFIFHSDDKWLLSFEQMKICDEIDQFAAQKGHDLGTTLLILKKIKDMAQDNAVELTPILADTDVETPKMIDIDLRAGDDTIYVTPALNNVAVSSEKFAEGVDKWRRPRNIYTEDGSDGKVKRVVFTPEQADAISKIKKHKVLRGKDKDTFLKNPQEFFDPDHVNLDNFGERVVEIGCYIPRYLPFVSVIKSQWFAEGITIELSPDVRHNLVVGSEEALIILHDAINEATRNLAGMVKLTIPGDEENAEVVAEFPLEVAIELYERAKKRIATLPSEQKAIGAKEVIKIHDNIDEVGHDSQSGRKTDDFRHKFELPPHIRSDIQFFDHQKEGIAWLQELCRIGKGSEIGALLADDMGLGKTLQVLAFLEWHKQETSNESKPYLIVAPVALLENWEREYKNFFPDGKLLINQCYGYGTNSFIPQDYTGDIFLTTYETLRKRQMLFCQIDWAVVIIDEAQKIKSPGILTTIAVKALKAEMRIALTGTPVENTLVDLWSIVDFAVPGYLGSAKDFAKIYQRNYESKEEIIAVGESLRTKLGIFFKRRLKENILRELPPKEIFLKKQEMPDVQLAVYGAALKEIALAKEQRIENIQAFALKSLHKLRSISNHPFLVTMEEEQLYLIKLDELIQSSAKLSMTVEVMKEIEKRNEKLILFAIHRPVQRFLQRVAGHVLNISLQDIPIINGETPANEQAVTIGKETRQRAIDRFQSKNGCGAIVISPLAAGFGLNITGANNVIHYERHWNPAKENQATDRTHRIGQDKTVSVYYPMAVTSNFPTFDTVLHERLEFKRGLAEGVLFPTESAEVTALEMLESLA